MRGAIRIISHKDGGFTLIEMLVVLAIIAVLLGIATISFSTWVQKYEIERQVYVLHSNLQKARADAMFKGRKSFVVLNEKNYSIVADTDPAPFGDGVNNPSDTVVLPQTSFSHPIDKASAITFDPRGLTFQIRTICIFSQADPDVDCLVVHKTRINMGKIIKQTGECKSDNCRTR